MSRSSLSSTVFLFASGAIVALVGCGQSGPSTLQVKGKVTVKGEPAQNVEIVLHAKDNQTFTGKTGDDGTFIISGVKEGDMVVTINSTSGGAAYHPGQKPAQDPKASGGGMYGKGGAAGSYPKGDSGPPISPKNKEKVSELMKEQEGKMPTLPSSTKIPSKYSDTNKSGLTWNVSPATLVKDFDLTD